MSAADATANQATRAPVFIALQAKFVLAQDERGHLKAVCPVRARIGLVLTGAQAADQDRRHPDPQLPDLLDVQTPCDAAAFAQPGQRGMDDAGHGRWKRAEQVRRCGKTAHCKSSSMRPTTSSSIAARLSAERPR